MITQQQIDLLIEAFKILDVESLNQDYFSFKNKYVTHSQEGILKIGPSIDINTEIEIIKAAEQEGISFYLPLNIIYIGTLTFCNQQQLCTHPISNYSDYKRKPTLNSWCPGEIDEEEIISGIVFSQYGEEQWKKILLFNKKYHLGNIYWRNIGFSNEGKIQCFDFQCGLARNERGYPYV
jgi:hypothetical protein